jgi:YihY family inner membrane protein
LGEEYYDVAYNLYANGELMAKGLSASNYVHTGGTAETRYTVAPVVKGKEGEQCDPVKRFKEFSFYSLTGQNTGFLRVPGAEMKGRNGEDLTENYMFNDAVLADVDAFLRNGLGIGFLLVGSLLFFSSLAFSGLEKAMGIIFAHRGRTKSRHFLVSAVLPYCFVLLLGITLLVVTFVSALLQAMAQESIALFGQQWRLDQVSVGLFYGLGVLIETLVLAGLYLVIPVGRTRLSHALIGGFSAAILWEILRHLLVWYLAHLSRLSVVYGSLSTAVVALFSMELAATLLLLGAQVIAEYEQLENWSH